MVQCLSTNLQSIHLRKQTKESRPLLLILFEFEIFSTFKAPKGQLISKEKS